MQVEGRRETTLYGRYTIEIYTFIFSDEGELEGIYQEVYTDANSDGQAECAVVPEDDVELDDVPNGVIEDVHEALHTAAGEI